MGEPLSREVDLESRVDARWQELGREDLGSEEPDPSLFGYILDELVRARRVIR